MDNAKAAMKAAQESGAEKCASEEIRKSESGLLLLQKLKWLKQSRAATKALFTNKLKKSFSQL